MAEKTVKIVVDTNLWVSYLLNGRNLLLHQLMLHENLDILSSTALRNELFEVLHRPKFQKILSPEQITRFQRDFDLAVLQIEVQSVVEICRDAKDNFLLALAQDGDADFLLTGDADLLALDAFGNTQILIIKDFIEHTLRN